jgi:hypothetical protein
MTFHFLHHTSFFSFIYPIISTYTMAALNQQPDGTLFATGTTFNFCLSRFKPSDQFFLPCVVSSLPFNCSVDLHKRDAAGAKTDWLGNWNAGSRDELSRLQGRDFLATLESRAFEYPHTVMKLLVEEGEAQIPTFIAAHHNGAEAHKSERGTEVTWDDISDDHPIKSFARTCSNLAYQSGHSYIARRNENWGSKGAYSYVSDLTLGDPNVGTVTITDIPLAVRTGGAGEEA